MEGRENQKRDRGRRRSGQNKARPADGNRKPSAAPPRPKQRQSPPPPQAPKAQAPREPIAYDLVFYDTHADAKRDAEQLSAKAKNTGQLNIVIRAEGDMDDPELLKFGKVFAGAAWTLIHERRRDEGWYDSKH